MNKTNIVLTVIAAMLLVGLGAAVGFYTRLANAPAAPVEPPAAPPAPEMVEKAEETEEIEEPENENPTPEEIALKKQQQREAKARATAKAVENAVKSGAYDDFDAMMARARAGHLPIVVVASRKECPHCRRLARAMHEEPFASYAAAASVLVCHVRVIPGDENGEKARVFAKNGPNQLSHFPYVACYRLNEDGSETKLNFSGRREEMKKLPASAPLSQVVMETVQEAFK